MIPSWNAHSVENVGGEANDGVKPVAIFNGLPKGIK